MSGDQRAQLYARLPLTSDVDWWRALAQASPDGRVLELGAGTGRLTGPLAEVATVVAVDRDPASLDLLRADHVDVHVVEADATELDLGDRFGLVLAPVSLLNEVVTRDGQRALVKVMADHCRRDGRLVFQLLNPVWLMTGRAVQGTIEGIDGRRVHVDVDILEPDLWAQQVLTRLVYTFDDGQRLVDEVPCRAVFPGDLEGMLAEVGMRVVEVWGAVPGIDDLGAEDGAWHVVAEPA